jgi:hypothetical protein
MTLANTVASLEGMGEDRPCSFDQRQIALSLLVHTTSEVSHIVSATREQGQQYPLSSPLHLPEHHLAHDGCKNDHRQEMCRRARYAAICFSLDPTSSLYEGILGEGHRLKPPTRSHVRFSESCIHLAEAPPPG